MVLVSVCEPARASGQAGRAIISFGANEGGSSFLIVRCKQNDEMFTTKKGDALLRTFQRLPVAMQTVYAELADRAWTGSFREII